MNSEIITKIDSYNCNYWEMAALSFIREYLSKNKLHIKSAVSMGWGLSIPVPPNLTPFVEAIFASIGLPTPQKALNKKGHYNSDGEWEDDSYYLLSYLVK